MSIEDQCDTLGRPILAPMKGHPSANTESSAHRWPGPVDHLMIPSPSLGDKTEAQSRKGRPEDSPQRSTKPGACESTLSSLCLLYPITSASLLVSISSTLGYECIYLSTSLVVDIKTKFAVPNSKYEMLSVQKRWGWEGGTIRDQSL